MVDEGTNNKPESKPSVDFTDVDKFVEKGEKTIENHEKKIDSQIEKEEEKIEKLEKQKEKAEEKEEEIQEKIDEEEEKVSELKKEEEKLEAAGEKAEKIRDGIKEKKTNIISGLKKIAEIFRKSEEKAEEPLPEGKSSIKRIYEKKYKLLLVIPFIMLLLAIGQISYHYNTTGDFVNRGVELEGGITLTIPGISYDILVLEEMLNENLEGDISVRRMSQTKGVLLEASGIDADTLLAGVQEIVGELSKEEYSLEEMGSSLGSSFFNEIIKAIVIAFILMGIVVFITFRVPAPSLAVILAALSDIIITLAIFNMTGAKLGKGGIAAFLMLIGYSVDTDILLSTTVLKRKFGSVMDRIYSAMKTGLTMNITTMAALVVALIFTHSDVIRQIMVILLIGLLVDIINTWIQNVGILRLYLERKERQRK